MELLGQLAEGRLESGFASPLWRRPVSRSSRAWASAATSDHRRRCAGVVTPRQALPHSSDRSARPAATREHAHRSLSGRGPTSRAPRQVQMRQADFFLSSSTSSKSASTTSSLRLGVAAGARRRRHRRAPPAAGPCTCASPSFIDACVRRVVLALIASTSSAFSASFSVGDRSLDRAACRPRRPCRRARSSDFSVEWTSASAWFLASTSSRRFLSLGAWPRLP